MAIALVRYRSSMVNSMGPAEPNGETNDSAALDEMAQLLAQYKLVPFFGAGLSRLHLGFAAKELAHELAQRIGAAPDTLLSDVADQFADKMGEEAFVRFLKDKLIVLDLDEAKASAHLLLLSLSLNLLYTTNQDNIFELAAARYGRPYRRVVTLDDLSRHVPGDRLLIKYHGDADVPASLVFGARSYEQRMATEDHPLDIKADLLGKQLLFLGYSLEDENVTKLLRSVRRAFGGHMPPSYFIAFNYDATVEELGRPYGLRIVDPGRLFPNAETAAEAFERCLKTLCDRTLELQAKGGLESLVSEGPFNPRMVTEYEVDAVARIIDKDSFRVAVDTFRGKVDMSVIPNSLQHRVADLFSRLVAIADPTKDEELNALREALFQLRLPHELALEATTSLMAACNRRPVRQEFDELTGLTCPELPDHALPLAASLAVAILKDRGEVITDGFRQLASFWFDGYQHLPAEVRETVITMITVAWPGASQASSPLNRPRGMRTKGFHEIVDDFMSHMPKQFRTPKE
jgi:hypothetical protein